MGRNNRNRETRRTAADQDATRALPASVILALVLVLVGSAAVGAFAIWKHTQTVEPQAEQEQDIDDASQNAEQDRADRILSEMSLKQKVAQLFIVTPESITGVETAVQAGDATREAISKYPVGGIIYFAANLQDPSQTKELLRNSNKYAKDASGLPLFLCVDEEGGTVSRIASNPAFGITDVGNMSDVGSTDDAEVARKAALEIGSYLAELGFNVDFAPVADIATSADGTMELRSFGSEPDLVADMVCAQVEGFTKSGVLSAAKHFPGIGGAEGDSHNGRIYSHRTAKEMKSWELVPFKAAIEADVPMIMVGHLSCLELNRGEGDLPASLSPAVINGLLRKDLGYDGLVVTDSLEMGALDGVCAADEQGVLAIEAGADLILMPSDFTQAYEGLLAAVEDGDINEDRIDESVRRIIDAKLRFGL